jgi:hypothetical protein
MILKDAVLLTLINAVACLAFPKLLSIILSPNFPKFKANEALPQDSLPEITKLPLTSFPYCTTYIVTGKQSCKFSPHFCARCSPNIIPK